MMEVTNLKGVEEVDDQLSEMLRHMSMEESANSNSNQII